MLSIVSEVISQGFLAMSLFRVLKDFSFWGYLDYSNQMVGPPDRK